MKQEAAAQSRWNRFFSAVDTLVAVTALLCVFLATNLDHVPSGLDEFLTVRLTLKSLIVLTAITLAWTGILRSCRLYSEDRPLGQHSVRRTLGACVLGAPLFAALPLASDMERSSFLAAALCWVLITTALALLRLLPRLRLARPWARKAQNVIIIGTGPRAHRLYQDIQNSPGLGYNLLGFVDSDYQPVLKEIADQVIGSFEDLETILMEHPVNEVLLALPVKSCYDKIQQSIYLCEKAGLNCKQLLDVFHSELATPYYEDSTSIPIVSFEVVKRDSHRWIKRTIDIVGAAVGMVILAPLLVMIAAAIKLTSPGPVIYSQFRYGLNRRLFRMYKFRTMVVGAELQQEHLEKLNEAAGPVFKIRNDPRITPIGKILRKTSLDELPQLYNVLAGEMSLVGPRPLPIRDVARFDEPSLIRRFSVPPGITCLWQITGRSNTDFSRWIELDLQYIDNWSMGLDFKILAQTLPAVVRGQGAV